MEDFYLTWVIFYYYYFVKASIIFASTNYCQLHQCGFFMAFILHIWENDSNSFHPNFPYLYSVTKNSDSFHWRTDCPMHFKREKGHAFHFKWPLMLLVACTGGRRLLTLCYSCCAWLEAQRSPNTPSSQELYDAGVPAILCSVRHVMPEENFCNHRESLGVVGYDSWVTPTRRREMF